MIKKSETLGEIVKKARKGKKISARKLAQLCDVSHTEINNIEKGIRIKPALLTLKGFEKYLGLDYETIAKLSGYSKETIKYGEKNVVVSYEKYDQIIQDYRNEIEHVSFLCESKRRLGMNIKEYVDDLNRYIDSLDNVPENVKNDIKNIYALLESLDYKFESLMQEK